MKLYGAYGVIPSVLIQFLFSFLEKFVLQPDSRARYGTITRIFHWLMAIGFACIFLTAALHFFADKWWLSELLWPAHKTLGTTLFILALLRVLWVVASRAHRPQHISRLAGVGHFLLYALMLAIPGIGLLRQYGSDRSFSYLGIQVMESVGAKVPWMVDLGGLLHGELGWALLAIVVGHVGFVYWHRAAGHEDVLPRMWGQPQLPPATARR